jgi:Ca2+-binding RTX toxin-like protein
MSLGAGSTFVAEGVGAQPTYAFQPPASFLDRTVAPTPSTPIFDIRSFGAVEGAGHNSLPAIQAAVDAAHAAGGGIVYLPPGVWGVGVSADGYGSVHLADNVFLQGAGMGLSTLRLMDGTDGTVTGIVRTPWGETTTNCGVADLTIDGNRANTTAQVDGFFTGPQPGSPLRDSDIHVLRVEIKEVSRYGFDPHEQTERLVIRDCVAHDNTFDGFVLDYVIDSEITGNVSYANGRHGFNIVTQSNGLLLRDNVAHSNGGSGFVVQRGSEDIPSSHNVTIEGGAAYDNGRHGVLLLMAHDVVVSGMDIHGNGLSGIRLHGASRVTVDGNQLHDNSQAAHDSASEIEILAYVDTVHAKLYSADDNLITRNTIAADGPIAARYGVEERPGDTSGNVVADNTFSGTVRGAMALAGDGVFTWIVGTEANDTLIGGSAADRLMAGDGNDSLSGLDSGDWLEGGSGLDTLMGGAGNDTLDGGDDGDLISGGSGADIIIGGGGNDTLTGETDADILHGGLGDDSISGGTGTDLARGGSGNDTLAGESEADTLDGGEGNDVLLGGSDADVLIGGAGDDVINGGAGTDTLYTMDGWSSLGSGGASVPGPCVHGAGSGVIVDLAAGSALGGGVDTIFSIEVVVGTPWADGLTGDSSAEVLLGEAGNDVLRGRGGADTLAGGAGKDFFVWGATNDVWAGGAHQGVDTIIDFETGRDLLDMRGLTAGRPWTSLDEIVTATDGAAGTMVSFSIAGTFQDVVLLEGVHGLDAYGLWTAGLLVV